MQYFPLVTVSQTPQQLVHEQLYIVRVQWPRVFLHVSTQVCVLGDNVDKHMYMFVHVLTK